MADGAFCTIPTVENLQGGFSYSHPNLDRGKAVNSLNVKS